MGKQYHHDWHQANKEKCRIRSAMWRIANPEKYKAIRKRSYLKRQDKILYAKYGISWKKYQEINISQNGVCAICKRECTCGRKLAVDHAHKTGVVRGLLCSRCNRGIGLFGDSADMLDAASNYLKK